MQKLFFHLVQDDDGYPPFTVESVWASSTDRPDEYRVDDVPFFARKATIGDIVRATGKDGQLVFDRLVVAGTNSLIRVIAFDDAAIPSIRKGLANLGCSSEYMGAKSIIAVDVPETTDLAPVRAYLDAGEKADVLTYEEAILRHA